MELEKYIKVVREAINTGYYDVQDALMNRDESLKRLKDKGWKDDETAYQQEYQKIIDTFNQEIADAQAKYEEKVQEEKDGYMKEVKEFYASDGSRIDLNFMNLIKAELPLTAEEITDAITRFIDNPTMLRVINKYVSEHNAHSFDHAKVKLDQEYEIALHKAGQMGKIEKRIFETFVTIATDGLNHPDESYTMHQANLDLYEKNAILDLLKSKIFIDEETKERIDQVTIERDAADKVGKEAIKNAVNSIRTSRTFTRIQ